MYCLKNLFSSLTTQDVSGDTAHISLILKENIVICSYYRNVAKWDNLMIREQKLLGLDEMALNRKAHRGQEPDALHRTASLQ